MSADPASKQEVCVVIDQASQQARHPLTCGHNYRLSNKENFEGVPIQSFPVSVCSEDHLAPDGGQVAQGEARSWPWNMPVLPLVFPVETPAEHLGKGAHLC